MPATVDLGAVESIQKLGLTGAAILAAIALGVFLHRIVMADRKAAEAARTIVDNLANASLASLSDIRDSMREVAESLRLVIAEQRRQWDTLAMHTDLLKQIRSNTEPSR